jgi:hypothetical protein
VTDSEAATLVEALKAEAQEPEPEPAAQPEAPAERPEIGAGADAQREQARPAEPEAEAPAGVAANAVEQEGRARTEGRLDERPTPTETRRPLAAEEADALAPQAIAPAGQIMAEEPKAAGRFFPVQADEASTWLGIELRTLPDLELQRVEVGPGSAVEGGLQGLPAVRLVYRDAGGHELTLIQQRLAPGAATLGDYAGPAFYLDPHGRNAYRWFDTDGRLLILSGDVSGDSLRALADRVR